MYDPINPKATSERNTRITNNPAIQTENSRYNPPSPLVKDRMSSSASLGPSFKMFDTRLLILMSESSDPYGNGSAMDFASSGDLALIEFNVTANGEKKT